MSEKKKPEIDANSREMDQFFIHWIDQKISPAERAEWLRLLSKNSVLRENFCDWVRSLREPTPPNARVRISQRG